MQTRSLSSKKRVKEHAREDSMARIRNSRSLHTIIRSKMRKLDRLRMRAEVTVHRVVIYELESRTVAVTSSYQGQRQRAHQSRDHRSHIQDCDLFRRVTRY